MSGVLENVVENWLTSATERGYQASFAALLASDEHEIVYYSGHEGLEQGKDIVTKTRDGRYHAFQLKVGNISVTKWRSVVEEVKEASNLPMSYAGIPSQHVDTVTFVTSGSISDNAREKIRLVGETLTRDGFAPISTLEKAELVNRFTTAFESFLPESVADFVELLRLYSRDSNSVAQCGDLALCFERAVVAGDADSNVAVRRLLSGLLIMGEFLASRYRLSENQVSVIQVWTATTVACLMVKERHAVDLSDFDTAESICKAAIQEASNAFVEQWRTSSSMLTDSSFGDVALVGVRRLYALSYLAAIANSCWIERGDDAEAAELLTSGVREAGTLSKWGEGAWNFHLNIACALHRHRNSWSDAVACVEEWITYLLCDDEEDLGPPDPYHTLEEEFERLLGRLDGAQVVRSGETFYTLASAVDFLARAGAKFCIKRYWKRISKKRCLEMVPDDCVEGLKFRMERGIHQTRFLPMRTSWAVMQREAVRCGAKRFAVYPWLLPFYLLFLPHRVGTCLSFDLHRLAAHQYFKSRWVKGRTFGRTTA